MDRQGPKVLLVDDEESIQQTLSAVLPLAGYTVYQVRDGKEAVRELRRSGLI
jgi:CheY-like chemotaxis protein